MLRAPGMLALHLRLDTVEAPTRVRVWDDVVKAYDMGALAAQWFSDFLGRQLRLVRFDPEETAPVRPRLGRRGRRLKTPLPTATRCWWPMQASLDELNGRLAAKGVAPVTMQRFRPNLVLVGPAGLLTKTTCTNSTSPPKKARCGCAW
jgi:uncharacterized protein YcbX